MKDLNNTGFADRLDAGARARAQRLERARVKRGASQAGAPERAAIRSALAARRIVPLRYAPPVNTTKGEPLVRAKDQYRER